MKYLRDPTMLFALGLMTVVLMMVLPVPSWILDLGLAASFAIAILIFTTALFAERPLDFSSFPTVLIASLMLRLSLNISSTKLIISQGHEGSGAAGSVIEGFAKFVMGGSIVLGLIIFCVLLIVNFVVITKGATRMAEVGARFALDGMPGKQLAIDSDVAAGAINHEEARARRETELAETTFFGSLDGASKFVKGDAIAGLLITILNLVAGLAVGLIVHDMPLLEAMENFVVLTVGDGLVSQIPAVIISIASALLLARGGAKGKIDATILVQIGSNPVSLITVATILLSFAIVPGLPFLPFSLGSGAAAFAAWRIYRRQANENSANENVEIDLPIPKRSIGDVLDLEDISVTFAHDLVGLALDPTRGLESRIDGMRNHIAKSFGVILPEIHLTDDSSLAPGTYVIRIQGVEMARDKLRPGHILVLKSAAPLPAVVGVDVAEPVYGAPARWVPENTSNRESLADLTTVSPDEVLATHLMEVVKSAFPQLIGIKALNRILDSYREVSDPTRASENRRFLDDLVPNKVPYDTLILVMRLLLTERISIRNLPVIIETIAEGRDAKMTPELIVELVRQRLGLQITSSLRRADGVVPLIQLSSVWEDIFQRHQAQGNAFDVTLPPDIAKKFRKRAVEIVTKAAEDGNFAGIITSARRRRFVFSLLRDTGISNPVLSYDEIDPSIRPSLVGSVAA